MTGEAVVRAASAGAARRLVQSVVVFGVLATSSAAAVFGLMLLTSINEGFNAGCAATHCADLAVTIRASKAAGGQLAATRHLPGVTQAAGPYPQATITVAAGAVAQRPSGHGTAGGLPAQQVTVVGRASPASPLDHIADNPPIMNALTHGHSRWPTAAGEISLAMTTRIRLPLGGKLTVISAPGKPQLTVVGYGSQPQVIYEDAWVTPGQIAALRAAGTPAREQMLYDFSHAATTGQIAADLAELKHALPVGAVASSQSWLAFAQTSSQQNSANAPFAVSFAVLALVLAVLIVANIVSAAVVASYQRIGVLKSIGFTPAQVSTTYLIQIGLPALVGAIAGTLLGGRWVLPVIGEFPGSGGHLSVPLWLDISVPLGMLALTGLAALVPALRAGRLSAAAAITAGQAPRAGHGYAPHRLAGRIALPRPMTIGLAAPFSRPARSAVTLAALTFGLAGVVLAAGLNASIHKINYSSLDGLGQVQAGYRGGSRQATLTPGQNARIEATLRSQPGTAHYVAETDLMPGPPVSASGPAPSSPVAVAGQPGLQPSVYAYRGDSSWLGWNLISGHWYHGPHQADANSVLLAATGTKVGGSLALTVNHKPVTVRITGQVFTPNGVPTLFTSSQALGGAAAGSAVSHYDIALTPGTSTGTYIAALTRALGPGYIAATPAVFSGAVGTVTSYFKLLALLVAVLAALGVLNSVLMATRERVHDLGVFKAIGMTPRQSIAMVTCSVITPAIIAAVIALPAGLIIQGILIRHLAAQAGMVALPARFVYVLGTADLALLALAGLVIAIAGALGPATWAAAARTTTALHAE